jgi:hypothetical protein
MAAEVSIKRANVEVGELHSLGIPVTAPDYRYDVSLDGQLPCCDATTAGVSDSPDAGL